MPFAGNITRIVAGLVKNYLATFRAKRFTLVGLDAFVPFSFRKSIMYYAPI
jgi:hypothetical protein